MWGKVERYLLSEYTIKNIFMYIDKHWNSVCSGVSACGKLTFFVLFIFCKDLITLWLLDVNFVLIIVKVKD